MQLIMRLLLFALLHVPGAVASGFQIILSSENCCSLLQNALGEKISFPNQPLYNVSRKSYWSRQESQLSPSCIVRPESASDVSIAVRILTSSHESRPICKFAIKGGGHAMSAGAANIEHGVTIDLDAMNAVTVNEAKNVTSVGAGARWLDVYSKLCPMGLAVPGGRDSNVGVGGLTLGGGLSHFAARFGFVCDNVVNFEVVLASGKIFDVNNTSYQDLFFALKGGSNNFAVVTRFDLKTFSQGDVWGGSIMYNIATKEQQIDAFVQLAAALNHDPYASLIHGYAFLPWQNSWVISNTYVYTKPEPYPEVFGGFMSIGQKLGRPSLRTTNLTDLAVEMDGSNPSGKRQIYVTVTVANDARLLSQVFDIADAILQPIKKVPGVFLAFAYQPISKATMYRSQENGGNALGLDPNDGDLVLIFVNISWNDTADDEAINQQTRRFLEEVEARASSLCMLRRWKYLNYAAQWQDPVGSYGSLNSEKLRSASRRYDPERVFQKQVPGGFKLF